MAILVKVAAKAGSLHGRTRKQRKHPSTTRHAQAELQNESSGKRDHRAAIAGPNQGQRLKVPLALYFYAMRLRMAFSIENPVRPRRAITGGAQIEMRTVPDDSSRSILDGL
jgi:hypothetical protein